ALEEAPELEVVLVDVPEVAVAPPPEPGPPVPVVALDELLPLLDEPAPPAPPLPVAEVNEEPPQPSAIARATTLDVATSRSKFLMGASIGRRSRPPTNLSEMRGGGATLPRSRGGGALTVTIGRGADAARWRRPIRSSRSSRRSRASGSGAARATGRG